MFRHYITITPRFNLLYQPKLKSGTSSTTVGVGIGQKADGAFSLDLDITITVAGLSVEEAKQLIEKAHTVCPYSNATRGNVDVRLHVNVVQSFDL